MTLCQFCGLDSNTLYFIYDIEVCHECTDLAEIAFAGDDESDYIQNMSFDMVGDR